MRLKGRGPANGRRASIGASNLHQKPDHMLLSLLASAALLTEPTDVPTAAAAPQSIYGEWATQGYGAVVDIRPCDTAPQELCGWLTWAWDPDDMQPGALGGLMLWGATYDGEHWRGGRLKNPEDGRTFRGRLWLKDDDTLSLRGCAGPFCQTQTWRRLRSLPHIRDDCVTP